MELGSGSTQVVKTMLGFGRVFSENVRVGFGGRRAAAHLLKVRGEVPGSPSAVPLGTRAVSDLQLRLRISWSLYTSQESDLPGPVQHFPQTPASCGRLWLARVPLESGRPELSSLTSFPVATHL